MENETKHKSVAISFCLSIEKLVSYWKATTTNIVNSQNRIARQSKKVTCFLLLFLFCIPCVNGLRSLKLTGISWEQTLSVFCFICRFLFSASSSSSSFAIRLIWSTRASGTHTRHTLEHLNFFAINRSFLRK